MLPYMQIDERAVRLDQVVGKVEGILFAVVEQTDSRVQAVGHQSARDGAAQDGVAIIERAVDQRSSRR